MSKQGPILTLEPLVEGVRDGLETAGWALSGLQKTTSHEFEGRWAGESTRSAYLFFHRDENEEASIDVYLDETSRGLQGNLALVVELEEVEGLPGTPSLVGSLAELAAAHLPEGYRTPISLRYRLADSDTSVTRLQVEARIKLRIPGAAVEAGANAVSALSAATARSFEAVLADARMRALLG